jgi:hypothetical protein
MDGGICPIISISLNPWMYGQLLQHWYKLLHCTIKILRYLCSTAVRILKCSELWERIRNQYWQISDSRSWDKRHAPTSDFPLILYNDLLSSTVLWLQWKNCSSRENSHSHLDSQNVSKFLAQN